MNSDRRNPATDAPADRGGSAAASRPTTTRQALRDVRDGIVAMWWGFFDWLAVVSWKMLLLVSLLSLILAANVQASDRRSLMLIIASFIIKVVAAASARRS